MGGPPAWRGEKGGSSALVTVRWVHLHVFVHSRLIWEEAFNSP